MARAPLASERLEQGPGKLLIYRLRHRWRDGTTHVLFEPVELLERLAALVPPPRFNQVRYHGVLGPAASRRATVVSRATAPDEKTMTSRGHAGCTRAKSKPGLPEAEPSTVQPEAAPDRGVPPRHPAPAAPKNETSGPVAGRDEDRPRRYAWAELMRRVFAVDVLECPRCAGRMRILTAIHPPTATRAILECLDLPSRAPPVAPPPPEAFGEELDVDINFGA